MYSSWWPAISQRMEKTSNENYVSTVLFFFPLLPVVLSLRDVPTCIQRKPKWEGAQAVVRGAQPPPPVATALLPPTWAKSFTKFNPKMQDFKRVLDLNCK